MVDLLPDYRDSPFLQFGQEPFARALHFLETLTDQWFESGQLWDKTPTDLTEELVRLNAAQRMPATPDITLAELKALSGRRIRAFEETGWHLTRFYRPICFMDRLIEQALAAEQHAAPTIPPSNLKTTGEVLSADLAPAL